MFKRIFSGVASRAKSLVKSALPTLAVALMMAFAVVPGSLGATEVTLPTTVNVGDYASAAITLMASVVAVAVGGYAAFLVVRKALRWIGKALG